MRQRTSTDHPSARSSKTKAYLRPGAVPRGRSFAHEFTHGEMSDLDTDSVDEDNDEGGSEPMEWTEEEIVLLHWRLLQDVRHLAEPATPLDEKLSTLRWIFTEPEKDARPFSFVNCLRVVGCSPLSPIAYCGRVDSEAIREHVASNARRWLIESLASYPDWVTHALADNPAWVEAQLARNPQCINEQVKQTALQGDLFA